MSYASHRDEDLLNEEFPEYPPDDINKPADNEEPLLGYMVKGVCFTPNRKENELVYLQGMSVEHAHNKMDQGAYSIMGIDYAGKQRVVRLDHTWTVVEHVGLVTP